MGLDCLKGSEFLLTFGMKFMKKVYGEFKFMVRKNLNLWWVFQKNLYGELFLEICGEFSEEICGEFSKEICGEFL